MEWIWWSIRVSQMQHPDLHFRDELRDARAAVQADAEQFSQLCFTLERYGAFLIQRRGDLGKYREAISRTASRSPLAELLPSRWGTFHTPWSILYEMLRDARNDALHQGARARHLAKSAVQLSIILEDALMYDKVRIADFMTRSAICAAMWQPVSFIRQQMLEHSFSFLPTMDPREQKWMLVSDRTLAQFLRTDRHERLAKPLEEAIALGLALEPPDGWLSPSEGLDVALSKLCNRPILVVRDGPASELLGIATAFDLL
jgi:hypothetical protein